MNNFYNIKYPEFMIKYGKDWDSFKTILNETVDHYFAKAWALYNYRNINTTQQRALEWMLILRKILFDGSDTFLTKKVKLRTFVSQYRKKGLAEIYLDIQERVVGTRGFIVSGRSLGVWRWGYSRWRNPAIPGRKATDIRWSLTGSQFEIYINCMTTDDEQLDQITKLYRQDSVKPAFYQIYLVDDNYSILRII